MDFCHVRILETSQGAGKLTKKERASVEEALHHIMDDDGQFHEGIAILCKLTGGRYRAAELLNSCVPANFRKLASGPNRSFMVAGDRQRQVRGAEVCAGGNK